MNNDLNDAIKALQSAEEAYEAARSEASFARSRETDALNMTTLQKALAQAVGDTYPGERAELIAELERERARADSLAEELEAALTRIDRLAHHMRYGIVPEVLQKLADYAQDMGFQHAGDPHAPDPFPDPPLEKRRRKK